MYSALLTYKKAVVGRRKKKVRRTRQWGGSVYACRRTDDGGYLAFFSVAGTRHVNDLIMRILKSTGSHFFSICWHFQKLVVEETDSVEGHYHVVGICGFYN